MNNCCLAASEVHIPLSAFGNLLPSKRPRSSKLCWLFVELFTVPVRLLPDHLAVLHMLCVLAGGGCGHVNPGWGMFCSDFEFGSNHPGVSQSTPLTFQLSLCSPKGSTLFLPAVPSDFLFLKTGCCKALAKYACRHCIYSSCVSTEPGAK